MSILKAISSLNRKIPKTVRFIISLVILNIPPIIYLSLVKSNLAPIYVAIVFLLINISALIAYFKIKEIEVEVPYRVGRIRVKR